MSPKNPPKRSFNFREYTFHSFMLNFYQYEIEYEVDKPKHGYLKASTSKANILEPTFNTTNKKGKEFFLCWPSLGEHLFWPPSMVYISVITHITNYISSWCRPSVGSFHSFMYCINTCLSDLWVLLPKARRSTIWIVTRRFEPTIAEGRLLSVHNSTTKLPRLDFFLSLQANKYTELS